MLKHRLRRLMRPLVGWTLAISFYLIAKTCRIRVHRDLRQSIRNEGKSYLFATLHAQLIGSTICSENGTCAMASRSKDGAILVPILKVFSVKTIRGSAGLPGKGGATAMGQLIKSVREGAAGVLAVDGPAGPRGKAHKGIALAAKKTECPVLAVLVVPRRRWVLAQTWDRLQIPKPFTVFDVYFSRPLYKTEDQSLDEFTLEVENELDRLERYFDPEEHAAAYPKRNRSPATKKGTKLSLLEESVDTNPDSDAALNPSDSDLAEAA